MKRSGITIILLSGIFFLFLEFMVDGRCAAEPAEISVLPCPAVDGAFLGILPDGRLLLGGGRLADGEYRDELTIYKIGGDGNFLDSGSAVPFEKGHTLAAAVSTPFGAAIFGGENEVGLSAESRLIISDGERGIRVRPLPDLPTPRAESAAVLLGNRVFLLGGRTADGPTDEVIALDLASPESGWETSVPLPKPVEGGAAVLQSDGRTNRIWFMGGRSDDSAPGGKELLADMISFAPGENAWRSEPPFLSGETPRRPEKIAAARIGCSAILLFCGEEGPDGGFVRLYNTVTRRWSDEENFDAAIPPSFALAAQKECVFLAAGELQHWSWAGGRSFGALNYAVLFGYMALMLGIGFHFARTSRSAEAFYHGRDESSGGGTENGERGLPWWAVGISLFATILSAITFLSMPAKAFATDWSMLFFNLGILLVAPIVILFYLPRFRRIGGLSAYQYLEERFNRAVRLFASGLFVVFMVSRIAIVLYLPAIALGTVTGFDVFACILATGGVTLIYSTAGGMKAVVWGDVVQGTILVFGAIISLIWLIYGSGGAGTFLDLAVEGGKMRAFDFSFDLTRPVFWVVLLGGFSGSLITYTSDQTAIQRYMTTVDQRGAVKSIWLNAALSIPITVVFFLIGTALYTHYHTWPGRLDPTLSHLDAIYPYYMVNGLAPGLAGLLIAAVFAAAMSTLSSNINSASAAILSDFVRPIRPSMATGTEIAVGRVAGIIVAAAGILLALALATWEIQSLWDQFNTFLGLLTGTLGALFLIGFFLPRVGGGAALCGVAGSVAAIFWLRSHSDVSFLLYGLLEMIVCVGISLTISLFAPRRVTKRQSS